MWKKSIPVLLGILLFTAFSSNAAAVSRSASSLHHLDGISWETDKKTYTSNEVISLSLKNNTSDPIYFGAPYGIEVFKKGTWQKTSWTDDLMFTQQIITLSPGETYETTVDLNNFEDRVSPGYYRVVKQITVDGKPYNIGAAFHIIEN